MAAAFAMTAAAACRRTAVGSRARRSGGLTGGSGAEYTELFFNIAAGAFFALHRCIYPGNELFKLMPAIFANIFINRHKTTQKLFSKLLDYLTILIGVSIDLVEQHGTGQAGIFKYLQPFCYCCRRIFAHGTHHAHADMQR